MREYESSTLYEIERKRLLDLLILNRFQIKVSDKIQVVNEKHYIKIPKPVLILSAHKSLDVMEQFTLVWGFESSKEIRISSGDKQNYRMLKRYFDSQISEKFCSIFLQNSSSYSNKIQRHNKASNFNVLLSGSFCQLLTASIETWVLNLRLRVFIFTDIRVYDLYPRERDHKKIWMIYIRLCIQISLYGVSPCCPIIYAPKSSREQTTHTENVSSNAAVKSF